MVRLPVLASNLLRAAALIAALAAAPAARAVQPDEQLADPALEGRARELSRELRCLVCQNQSIDDSDASLARDLRLLVRERLKAGDSDAEVVDYLVARYGDFIRLKPPFDTATFLLWMSPLVLLLAGAGGIAATIRRRRAPAAPLSPEEERRVAELLAGPPDRDRSGQDRAG